MACITSSEPTQRSSSAIPFKRERRRSKARRCWFGCIWFSRVSLLGSSSSSSSPEPEEHMTVMDRITNMLNEKPIKMGNMLKVAKFTNNSTIDEKLTMFNCGILHSILDLIAEMATTEVSVIITGHGGKREGKRRHRRNSSTSLSHRGIGYGTGSTRSKWDIERTVEEKLAREEHLTWLLNAFNAYLVSWPLGDSLTTVNDTSFITPGTVKLIVESKLIGILETNLRNDSIFDVIEHMELYQSFMETVACMASITEFIPYLIKPYKENAKSIAKELIPAFRKTVAGYDDRWKNQMGSADFRMADFVAKVETLSVFIINAAEKYESTLPEDKRMTFGTRESEEDRKSIINVLAGETDADDVTYRENMKELQLTTYRFYGDFGKLIVPYSFKKDSKNINPFSPALRDRTKRIAKELASMATALPLNASNSIFITVDESRCDIIKALISGPDDTPYANGLFEFDIFFPTGYPYSPPKCAFLTTGAGNVRFNPNLYNDGKICLSILGTWEGRPEEKWNAYCSLMQVLVSIQGLIFVKDPYFNEPGFEKYQGTDKGQDYSRKYNMQIKHATLNYAIREQMRNPPEYFKEVIQKHIWQKRHAISSQAQQWLDDLRRDIADEKHLKKKETITFESGCNPFQQERIIQQLIQEIEKMENPFDQSSQFY
ncbi:unnamed protein product [Caenorhabditis bovis]|uniref:UBC core domain-containing protein n=1 Tax=Caenorhabditis bovis TaxID=2654633 RepID=A0A8S1E7H9_9PELO|nr:unnamed protein product [Caenorhabditis bovis]